MEIWTAQRTWDGNEPEKMPINIRGTHEIQLIENNGGELKRITKLAEPT
jgi:hypothetical protein